MGSAGARKKKTTSQRAAKGSASQVRPAFRPGNASTNPLRVAPDGTDGGKGSTFRSAATIRRLAMYRSKPDIAKMKIKPLKPVRIAPDRRWFSNTRVITQDKLSEFRLAMENASNDPYSVILKRSKLPLSLFSENVGAKENRIKLLGVESFEETFGPKSTRKRPRLKTAELQGLLETAERDVSSYGEGDKDRSAFREADGSRNCVSEEIFKKGGSRRIWQELYKVVDSSDVLIQVIDARDPIGTRCKHLEKYLKKDRPHKHMILLFNKCDLIPTWATSRWVKILSREMPTVAFHASVTNPFGKNSLINLLRQYAALMKDKQHMSVGFIGYPNVGKSSVINTLRKKKVCKAAPVPGETRVWQFVSLTNRVHLIDCPGIVPSDPDARDEATKLLRGAVRAERVEAPEEYIDDLLAKVKREYLLKRYKFDESTTWKDAEEFLTLLARKTGKLRKGGEPDISIAARMVIYDWQRGRIPYFEPPPYAFTMSRQEGATVTSSCPASDLQVPTEPESGGGNSTGTDVPHHREDITLDDRSGREANDSTQGTSSGTKENSANEDATMEEISRNGQNDSTNTHCVKPEVRVHQKFHKLVCALKFDGEDVKENPVHYPSFIVDSECDATRTSHVAQDAPDKTSSRQRRAGGSNSSETGPQSRISSTKENRHKRKRTASPHFLVDWTKLKTDAAPDE